MTTFTQFMYNSIFFILSFCLAHSCIVRSEGFFKSINADIVDVLGDGSEKVSVRRGNDLCSEEKKCIEKRRLFVNDALSKFLDKSVTSDDTFKIGLVASGGGYRAMFHTAGACKALKEMGLFDCLMYHSTLSGSSWQLASYLVHEGNLQQSIDQLTQAALRHYLVGDPNLATNVRERMLAWRNSTGKKRSTGQQWTYTVDLFGALLASRFFSHLGDDRHNCYLSEQAQLLQDGKFPYPIYEVGEIVKEDFAKVRHEYYEFTPHEFGSSEHAAYIPTNTYGSQFEHGTLVNHVPEQNLGLLLGLFGSAFAATTFKRLQEEIEDFYRNERMPLSVRMLYHAIDRMPEKMKNKHVRGSRVDNFMYELEGNKRSKDEVLELVDAGALDLGNLAYQPLSGMRKDRACQVLIFSDSSLHIHDGKQLRYAEQYARKHNLKFPTIDYTDIDKKAVSIFKDEHDSQAPLVIYLPRVKDSAIKYDDTIRQFDIDKELRTGFCKTTSFVYTPEQVGLVVGLAEKNIQANVDLIKDAIAWKYNQLKSVNK